MLVNQLVTRNLVGDNFTRTHDPPGLSSL